MIYTAWCGDSRAVLANKGSSIQLSKDHKPSHVLERERIEKAGGIVAFGRVNGSLAISRAFGDFELKKPKEYITVKPDVTQFKVEKNTDFILICCDGCRYLIISNFFFYPK
jgi:serine/threonine protein phosphatase PrpC